MKLRRYQTNLNISGLGVIAFGGWGLLKVILLLLMDPKAIREAAGMEMGETVNIGTFTAVLLLFVLFDFAFRFYIGFSARREAKGKKKNIIYLVIAFLLLIASVISIIIGLVQISFDTIFDTIVVMVVEITSALATLELVISAIQVRKLRKIPVEEGM